MTAPSPGTLRAPLGLALAVVVAGLAVVGVLATRGGGAEPGASILPTFNAVMNAAGAVLLVTGFALVRAGRPRAHATVMLLAVACSTLFLVSYLVYHAQVGSVRYQGEGLARTAYLALLLSHTVLAATVPPLVIVVLVRAFRRRFDAHRRIARWTLPVWLWVSVTGVAIYLVLYGMP